MKNARREIAVLFLGLGFVIDAWGEGQGTDTRKQIEALHRKKQQIYPQLTPEENRQLAERERATARVLFRRANRRISAERRAKEYEFQKLSGPEMRRAADENREADRRARAMLIAPDSEGMTPFLNEYGLLGGYVLGPQYETLSRNLGMNLPVGGFEKDAIAAINRGLWALEDARLLQDRRRALLAIGIAFAAVKAEDQTIVPLLRNASEALFDMSCNLFPPIDSLFALETTLVGMVTGFHIETLENLPWAKSVLDDSERVSQSLSLPIFDFGGLPRSLGWYAMEAPFFLGARKLQNSPSGELLTRRLRLRKSRRGFSAEKLAYFLGLGWLENLEKMDRLVETADTTYLEETVEKFSKWYLVTETERILMKGKNLFRDEGGRIPVRISGATK